MNSEQTIDNPPHVTVCICTFKRPGLLKRLLGELGEQDTDRRFSYSIVVVDNDQSESARPVVEDYKIRSSLRVVYCVEPRQNIALARNKAVEHAVGEFVAFIDDDEFPTKRWLLTLFEACQKYRVDGVLGPVKPHFDQDPPGWVVQGAFFERPTYQTGYKMAMWETRTGNVIFLKSIVDNVKQPFLSEFGTGGEDVEFFGRMMAKGHVFIWCNEATVYESVPPERCTRSYLLRKALLRGSNSLNISKARTKSILTSVLAIPVYGIALPIILFCGQHHFINYLIRFCDHLGRILALLKMNPVKEKV